MKGGDRVHGVLRGRVDALTAPLPPKKNKARLRQQ